MTSTDQLIEQFKREWAAGERPSVDGVLAAIPDPAECERARRALEEFAGSADAPAYSQAELARLRADPAVERAAAVFDREPLKLGALVHQLRWDREIRLEQLTDAIIERLNLPPKPDKVKLYLHELETGLLDPRGISQAALDALAALLGTTLDRLRAAAARTVPPSSSREPAFHRAYDDGPPFSHVPPGYMPAPDGGEERDEIDETFTGGSPPDG